MPRKKISFDRAGVHGYANYNFSGDQDKRKSTIGYTFIIGGASISWSSRKQGIMDLSSCEAEYVAASYAACQSLWIEIMLEELKVIESKKIKLFVDNKSAIDLANHPMCHGRSKHVERRHHFSRDQVNK